MTRKKPDDYTRSINYEIAIGTLIGLSISSSVLATIEWLKWVRDELESEVIIELDNVMEQVKQLSIELCPKDSGALASSISLDSGTISEGDFANYSIYAGNEITFNKQGQPTSQYALFVHDGHFKPNGEWVPPQPFLTDALMAFEEEIEMAVSRAMREMGATE